MPTSTPEKPPTSTSSRDLGAELFDDGTPPVRQDSEGVKTGRVATDERGSPQLEWNGDSSDDLYRISPAVQAIRERMKAAFQDDPALEEIFRRPMNTEPVDDELISRLNAGDFRT